MPQPGFTESLFPASSPFAVQKDRDGKNMTWLIICNNRMMLY